MSDAEVAARLREQARSDLKLIRRAADALAELDRSEGLADVHADVLAALRIRIEGRERRSLDDLLSAAGNISGRRDLEEAPSGGEEASREWPSIEEPKRDWPGA